MTAIRPHLALLLVAASVVATLPMWAASALVGVSPCDQSGNNLHVYGPFPATRAKSYTPWAATTAVMDGCAYDALAGLVGDGDEDLGVNGGAFPAYNHCLAPVVPPELTDLDPVVDAVRSNLGRPVAHHVAASIHVHDNGGLGIAAAAGTDGPAFAHLNLVTHNGYYAFDWTDCIGDGHISDDPLADPADCGSGLVSWGTSDAYPTVAANTLWSDCQKPSDGRFWVFLVVGPFWQSNGPVPPLGRVTTSVPTLGWIMT